MNYKTSLKRAFCVILVVLTLLTSSPLLSLIGFSDVSLFASQVEAVEEIKAKEYVTYSSDDQVLTWPVKGSTSISQGFHKGSIDITGTGKTVVAAMGGKVIKKYTCSKNHSTNGDGKGTEASCCGGFGTGLVIKGTDGRYYWYAHMKGGSIPSSVKKNAKISKGAKIGNVGNTGYSFGAHLHFGISAKSNIYSKSGWVDPMDQKYDDVSNLKYFNSISVKNIKNNDATITAKTLKMNVDKRGFYLGKNKSSMKKYVEKYKGSITSFKYSLKKWCGALDSGTTYYYQFYVVVNGKEHKSAIKSFKTSGTSASTVAKTYTFAYNGNGGSGSISSQTVELNKDFTVKANTFTKSGYSFKGFTVQRKSDGKWFVGGQGWKSESDITKNKWNKKLYTPGAVLNVSTSWQTGSKTGETFTFYAQWKKVNCISHKWDGGKVTTAATTVKTGVKTYTCTKCNTTKTETIARSTTEKYFSKVYANNIKTNDAKIGGNIKSTAYKKGTGFYLGTSKDSMKRYTKNLKGKADASGSYTSIYFTLSGWYGKLKPNTTYYYSVFYIDKNGNECASVIKSFKTSGTSATKNIYTFAYNGNGGSGSVSSQSVEVNKAFTVKTNGFTRSGYNFTGYYVQRKSDGKWFVGGQGWKSESDITKNKWSKKLYTPDTVLNVSASWQTGSKANETFTFFAQWTKAVCTAHIWDSGKVTTAATTVKTGIKTYTCTACKATKTETIARSTTEKYFSSVYANNIKANDAKIGGNAKSTAQKKGTGFYIGTSKDSLKRITKNLQGKADPAGSYTSIYFTLSGWYGTLKPNTTYYYSIFYIDKNGNECASVIKSFVTPGYTFVYNANGASGSMSSQTVQLNQNLTVKENGFTKSGYTFVGYHAQRKSDGKWFVSGQGWKTESEISQNNWSKMIYVPGRVLKIDSSWQTAGRKSETVTFWAQWKK